MISVTTSDYSILLTWTVGIQENVDLDPWVRRSPSIHYPLWKILLDRSFVDRFQWNPQSMYIVKQHCLFSTTSQKRRRHPISQTNSMDFPKPLEVWRNYTKRYCNESTGKIANGLEKILVWLIVGLRQFNVQELKDLVEFSLQERLLDFQRFLEVECGAILRLVPADYSMSVQIVHETLQSYLVDPKRCLNAVLADGRPRCSRSYFENMSRMCML